MSNTNQERTYRVEVPDTYVDLKGTSFHLSGGHLVIEDGNEYTAAFPPGQWLSVEEVITPPATGPLRPHFDDEEN